VFLKKCANFGKLLFRQIWTNCDNFLVNSFKEEAHMTAFSIDQLLRRTSMAFCDMLAHVNEVLQVAGVADMYLV